MRRRRKQHGRSVFHHSPRQLHSDRCSETDHILYHLLQALSTIGQNSSGRSKMELVQECAAGHREGTGKREVVELGQAVDEGEVAWAVELVAVVVAVAPSGAPPSWSRPRAEFGEASFPSGSLAAGPVAALRHHTVSATPWRSARSLLPPLCATVQPREPHGIPDQRCILPPPRHLLRRG